jgi:hypothetical protein
MYHGCITDSRWKYLLLSSYHPLPGPCNPSLLSSRPSAPIFSYQSVRAVRAPGRLVEGLCRQCEFQLISLSYWRRCVIPGDIATLHSLHTWGGGASRGILRCLVIIHEPMAERNCPFCVLAGCPQWVCIWIIYLSVYVCCRCLRPCTLLHITILPKKQM